MADVPETLVAASIGAGASKSGKGMRTGLYLATKTGAADTVTFDDFSLVLHCIAHNKLTGALDPVTSIVGNVVTLSVGTGQTKLYVMGE